MKEREKVRKDDMFTIFVVIGFGAFNPRKSVTDVQSVLGRSNKVSVISDADNMITTEMAEEHKSSRGRLLDPTRRDMRKSSLLSTLIAS